uniref:alcohol dehydrogenase n=1 Tax=Panagrellus redivivus TaxID=6233 RepID=A0A7E4ZVL0_PANRE
MAPLLRALTRRSDLVLRQFATTSTRMMTIPETQMAQVYDRYHGPLYYQEIPVPKPGPLDILVNVKYTGVCHTDLHVWEGDFADQVKVEFPMVGGHEGVGIVVAKGSQVDQKFEIGDIAGIKWVNASCEQCEMCHRGYDQNCHEAQNSGLHVNGTFQQYAIVHAYEAPKLPQGIDMAKAAPILCAGITMYRALKDTNVGRGEWVAITGAGGGLGSIAIQYALAMGMKVVATDIGAERGTLCKKLGASHYVDAKGKHDHEVIDEMIELTSGGPHGVVHVAPVPTPFLHAARYVRTRGTIVMVSLPKDTPLGADTVDVVVRALTIRGSYVGNREDADEAIDFFARGAVETPIQIRGLSELNGVFKDMDAGRLIGRVVLDNDK